MHVEKNVGESLLGTMLHDKKSKDGVNSRNDLKDWGIRHGLHTQPRGKKTYLPPAPYTLSKGEKKTFCKRLYDFRGPVVIVQILKVAYHQRTAKLVA